MVFVIGDYVYCSSLLGKKLMNGEVDEVRVLLKKASDSKIDKGSRLYYNGVVETDGGLSANYLKESMYEQSSFADKELAVIRLANYYFTRGFYITAANQLKGFAKDYPKSTKRAEAGWLLGVS